MIRRNTLQTLVLAAAALLLAVAPKAVAFDFVESGQAVLSGSSGRPAGAGDGRVPADAPKVSFTGVVDRVALDAGPSLCSLTVREKDQTHTVILGSVRYLLDQDFSPKAGDTIKVQGFRLEDDRVAARRVELPGQKKKLDFRDGEGRPLWSGGARNRNGLGIPGISIGPGQGRGPGGGAPRGPGGGRGGRRP